MRQEKITALLPHPSSAIITINVPVVFMAWYITVLRAATSLRGALEGVGPENQDFLGPEMARAKRVPFGPKKQLAHWKFYVPKCCSVVLLCVVVCKRGGEVSLHLCCVRRYSGRGGWLAGLTLPLSLWHSLCSGHFRAQKSLDFQGPHLPMPLVMMLHPSKPLCISGIKNNWYIGSFMYPNAVV